MQAGQGGGKWFFDKGSKEGDGDKDAARKAIEVSKSSSSQPRQHPDVMG